MEKVGERRIILGSIYTMEITWSFVGSTIEGAPHSMGEGPYLVWALPIWSQLSVCRVPSGRGDFTQY